MESLCLETNISAVQGQGRWRLGEELGSLGSTRAPPQMTVGSLASSHDLLRFGSLRYDREALKVTSSPELFCQLRQYLLLGPQASSLGRRFLYLHLCNGYGGLSYPSSTSTQPLSLLPRTRMPDSFSTAEDSPRKVAPPENKLVWVSFITKKRKQKASLLSRWAVSVLVPGILPTGVITRQAEADSGAWRMARLRHSP